VIAKTNRIKRFSALSRGRVLRIDDRHVVPKSIRRGIVINIPKSNGGQFPRQRVYDAIDGRKRFPAHFIGDMPTWGLKYQAANQGAPSASYEELKRRISALVDYVKSLQEK
jgi:hypothetical protein